MIIEIPFAVYNPIVKCLGKYLEYVHVETEESMLSAGSSLEFTAGFRFMSHVVIPRIPKKAKCD